MDTKFTKGPWMKEDFSFEITSKECCLPIAKVTVFNEAKANAHLIASAPDMYKLLEELSSVSENYQESIIFWIYENKNKVEELLAKARGES